MSLLDALCQNVRFKAIFSSFQILHWTCNVWLICSKRRNGFEFSIFIPTPLSSSRQKENLVIGIAITTNCHLKSIMLATYWISIMLGCRKSLNTFISFSKAINASIWFIDDKSFRACLIAYLLLIAVVVLMSLSTKRDCSCCWTMKCSLLSSETVLTSGFRMIFLASLTVLNVPWPRMTPMEISLKYHINK